MSGLLAPAFQTLERVQPRQIAGRISSVRGLTLIAEDLMLPVGALVRVEPRSEAGGRAALGEVIASDRRGAIVMLFGHAVGLAPGDWVVALQTAQTVPLGRSMLGRVLDGLGRPIDGRGPLADAVACPISPDPVVSMQRAPIREPLPTGVRALDAMTTAGKGQRLGIFAGPGVGKSTLLASIARNTAAQASVIALIGERGREVQEFIEHSLGPEGLARSVVIVSTGDESPLLRLRAAMVATAAAEHLRDQGLDVVLIMDSVTRFCHAQRQIGLAAGEPPATKGYPPSVFAMLPVLLERAGTVAGKGSITGFYAVLVEGDDMTEPVSDAARGILDGHITLSRRLANRGHYPAVDVLDSVSRVADAICPPTQNQARRQLAKLLALYAEVEDLVNIGAYVRGANPEFDVAIDFKPRIDRLLQQNPKDPTEFRETVKTMLNLAAESGHALAAATGAKPERAR